MRAISVLDILEETAKRLPNKIFIQDETDELTYDQYRKEAIRIGYAIHRKLNGVKKSPIILFMDKNCVSAVCLAGILYSGNFYIVMDTKTPIDRLKSTLKTLETAVIISSIKETSKLRKIGYEGDVIILEEILDSWGTIGDKEIGTIKAITRDIIDTDLMYVIFTSGSTGIPKGVAAMHRSVVDYIESSIDYIGIEEDDIIGNQGPFYTDIPLRDIFMAMKAGATTCITPQRFFMSPKKLLQYLDVHRVTKLMWVPTAYRLLYQFDALSKIRPSTIKKILFVGEPIPIPVFRYMRKYYPNADYRQLYGPSEITGVCTYYNISRDYSDGENIPIGWPFPNTGILLLDEKGAEVPKTDTVSEGEICVYGTCLTAGYYNDPEKTSHVFIQNPTVKAYNSLIYKTGDIARYNEEGALVFVSRRDYQIKHGGRRIELGEIENAFLMIKGVSAACCIHNREKDQLVIYYVGNIPEENGKTADRERW